MLFPQSPLNLSYWDLELLSADIYGLSYLNLTNDMPQ